MIKEKTKMKNKTTKKDWNSTSKRQAIYTKKPKFRQRHNANILPTSENEATQHLIKASILYVAFHIQSEDTRQK